MCFLYIDIYAVYILSLNVYGLSSIDGPERSHICDPSLDQISLDLFDDGQKERELPLNHLLLYYGTHVPSFFIIHRVDGCWINFQVNNSKGLFFFCIIRSQRKAPFFGDEKWFRKEMGGRKKQGHVKVCSLHPGVVVVVLPGI